MNHFIVPCTDFAGQYKLVHRHNTSNVLADLPAQAPDDTSRYAEDWLTATLSSAKRKPTVVLHEDKTQRRFARPVNETLTVCKNVTTRNVVSTPGQ